MNRFHAFFHGHHHPHGRHHDHHHGHHASHRDAGRDGASRLDHLADKAARKLDLDAAQQAKLSVLLNSLQQQRNAMRGDTLLQDVQGLLAGASLDRGSVQSMLDARLAAAQAAVPALIGALGDFYDALDAEQQQVLRFLVRLGQRGRPQRRGEQ